jgi:DNA repair photolyase
MLGPMIPGLTDHEIPAIVAAAAQAGARSASWLMVRLPFGVKDLFQSWLERHRPDRKDKVLNRLRELRNGKLNDPRFGVRMRGEGEWARQIDQLFDVAVARAGLKERTFALNTKAFRRPGLQQRGLF